MVRFTNSNDFYHGLYYLKYSWFKNDTDRYKYYKTFK